MRATAKQFARALAETSEEATLAQLQEAAKAVVSQLATEHRLGLLPKILRALDGAWRTRFGASRILVSSAHPLPKVLLTKFQDLAPGADLETHVDEALIGGAIVRLDDTLVDGSVAGALKRLEASLIHGS